VIGDPRGRPGDRTNATGGRALLVAILSRTEAGRPTDDAAVAYPCFFSSEAAVTRPGSMCSGAAGGRTCRRSGVRQQYRPVSSPYRVGEQTELGVWASVNRRPSRASRSMFGVSTSLAP